MYESQKSYYQRNKSKVIQIVRDWQKANPEKIKDYNQKRLKDPKWIAYHKNYNKKYQQNLKKKAIEYYSKGKNCCACCGETIFEFLTFDHINNDGFKKKDRTRNLAEWLVKNNFPPGFQVYCMNCNLGKHINNGICPHNKICTHIDTKN